MNNVNSFYKVAKKFCSTIESTTKFKQENCKELLLLLSNLYGEALMLLEVQEISNVELGVDRITVGFEYDDSYWEIYNPFECEEPVCGSLSDDFGDIYKDLKEGVLLYDKGHINDAIWSWKWSFRNHWSYHLVDALRVLNQLFYN